jgi:hypothetical protein
VFQGGDGGFGRRRDVFGGRQHAGDVAAVKLNEVGFRRAILVVLLFSGVSLAF